MIHELKIDPIFFEAVLDETKTFEIRKNDRPFAVGDFLALNELDDTRSKQTGRCCLVEVTYILEDEKYVKPGFVCMGIAPCAIARERENALMNRQPIPVYGRRREQ